MRILVISPSFYPKNSPRAHRAYELAKELATSGNEVCVFCDAKDYDYSNLSKEYGIIVKNIDGLKFYDAGNNGLKKIGIHRKLLIKILRYPIYFPDTELAFKIAKALKNQKGYDLLISIALPYGSHMGVAIAIRKNKELTHKWIADCGDPFYSNVNINVPFYFRYIEKYMFQFTDNIAIPFIGARNYYPKEFRNKLIIVPQGVDFNQIKLAEYKKNKVLTFAYSGKLYSGKRDPTLFLEYLLLKNIEFKFIVYTMDKKFFSDFHKQLGERLIVNDYIDRFKLIHELSQMDFLVNFENVMEGHLPSKLIDYGLTKRPILNVSSISLNLQVIEEFLDYNFINRFEIDNIDQYNIKNVAKQFLDCH